LRESWKNFNHRVVLELTLQCEQALAAVTILNASAVSLQLRGEARYD